MLPLQTTLILNLIPGGSVRPSVKVSQKDADSRTVSAQLYHGPTALTNVTGVSASVACTAPDGQKYTIPATLTAGNPATATFTIGEDVTEICGFVDCELVLTESGKRIGTGNFLIKVEPEPGAIKSAQYESIKRIMEATEAARDEINAVQSDLMNAVNRVENELYETQTDFEELQNEVDALRLQSEAYVDDMEVTPEGLVYLLHNGERVSGPHGPFAGGGGGGGSGNNAVLTVTNTTGAVSITIAKGKSCTLKFNWTSIENDMPTGVGNVRVTVNGSVRASREIQQGDVKMNVGPYLGAGTNIVKLAVSDVYGNTKTLSFNITAVEISISSSFDDSVAYNGALSFPYTPVGSVEKTVHFYVDGTKVADVVTSASGRQLTQAIPKKSHGAHSLEVYFTCQINGVEVESNRLFYDVIFIEEGETDVIITSDFRETEVAQYQTFNVGYTVYDPASLTAEVVITANGTDIQTVTVDRKKQTVSYRADTVGPLTLRITSGGTTKTINLTVTETDIDVEAETELLSLYLTAAGRSNNESNPGTWVSGDIEAVMTGFNFVSDGWQKDDNGITALRVAGDARVSIPYHAFSGDLRATGKTIEVEFATRDIMDYDADIITCMSGGRGISFTAQKALLKSEQTEISTQYKEDEHIRIAFVVEKRTKNRLLYVYINGILSGAVQYPDSDDFAQPSPVDISIGSNDCTTDIYCIRVYDQDLDKNQILENWIADTQNLDDLLYRYEHNNNYDAYGNIVIAKLPSDLPYMVITCPELPQYKGDKKTVSIQYVDPVNDTKSFTATNVQADVQGTSSQYYPRKNYKMKFRDGFTYSSGTTSKKYAMREGAIPASTFTFKADVASSEGANNVELARLYNDICPYKTPPQKANASIRQGIDGFPMVVFWNDGETTSFIGKYNFNNDKGTEEVFGFADGDESWEIKNNTSDRVLWKSDDFESTYTDEDGKTKPAWLNDFEGRYPEDNEDPTNLKQLSTWLKSTDQTAVSSDSDKAARLQKFIDELEYHMEKDAVVFYYLFTELFLMVDSRAKNAFPSFFGTDKWFSLPYDFDTALGINNEGSLVFGYELEDIDQTAGGADVFNGQQSVLWVNLRQGFFDDIKSMYQNLRSTGVLSYPVVEGMFEDHQGKWSEAIFNEDAQFKYLDPLIKEGEGSYLSMLQGSKTEQRKWWLYNRFRYMDSKYNAGDALSDVIQLRGYAKSDVTVTPYADIYASVKYGSYLQQVRATRGQSYTLVCPLDQVNDTEIYIYSASQLSDVGDLSGLKVGFADFSKATRITSIKVGDSASGYTNGHLLELYVGNNTLLKTVDARNCTALGTGDNKTVDLRGCKNIENVYFDGTAISGVELPDGGILKVLHLPGTITNLTLKNQTGLTDLTVPTYDNISTLWLDNVSSVVDSKAILQDIPASARVRIIGLHWDAADADEISDLYDILDTMRGLDEFGNNTEKAQVSGTIHTSALTGEQIAEFQARYEYITIVADHTQSVLKYWTYDGATLLNTENIIDGGDGAGYTAPARPSTAQYTYTFVGWALAPNATSANPNALKNVVANRDVYAVYTATVRTYNVYFYNGSTLLQTVENVPYGGSATYTGETPVDPEDPTAEFEGWVPQPTNIVGNTSCYAQYNAGFDGVEITDTWEQIVQASADGTYSTKYNLGDWKPLSFTVSNKTVTLKMQIVAFNQDTLSDNTGAANMTFISKSLDDNFTNKMNNYAWTNKNQGAGYGSIGGWSSCAVRTWFRNTVLGAIVSAEPSLSSIKKVKKTSRTYTTWNASFNIYDTELQTVDDSIWIPSRKEVESTYSVNETYAGMYEEAFVNGKSRKREYGGTAQVSSVYYSLRTCGSYREFSTVKNTTGEVDTSSTAPEANVTTFVLLGFCL